MLWIQLLKLGEKLVSNLITFTWTVASFEDFAIFQSIVKTNSSSEIAQNSFIQDLRITPRNATTTLMSMVVHALKKATVGIIVLEHGLIVKVIILQPATSPFLFQTLDIAGGHLQFTIQNDAIRHCKSIELTIQLTRTLPDFGTTFDLNSLHHWQRKVIGMVEI